MTVRDAWRTNFVFNVVMTVIAGALLAGVGGGIVMYAQVRANTEILQAVRTDLRNIRSEFGERLRYLERNRRGYVPGEP